MWTKNTDKSMFFQAGDNSMQQLCQEGKLKRNSRVMCVCVCVCVCVCARARSTFIRGFKGRWVGAGSSVHSWN
jgi:hypothetical protein